MKTRKDFGIVVPDDMELEELSRQDMELDDATGKVKYADLEIEED